MIAAMPRALPPFLNRAVTRHGRVVYYVRRGKGGRLRLRAPYDTAEFWAEYRAALEGQAPAAKNRSAAKAGSLAWLIERYRDSADWAALSMATRRQRENIFRHVIAQAGTAACAGVTRRTIVAGIDRRRATPAQAVIFLKAMRGLWRWACAANLVAADPTQGIRARMPKSEGFATWTPEWCAAFEARWPLGTRQRLAYDVLSFTGLRRGDAVQFGRPHVKDGIGRIKTEKTGEIVYIAISPEFAAALAAGPTGELTYIAGERGRPMSKEAFGNFFRAACRAAGVPGAAHGLRKARAALAAERGATESELDAMFGWRGGQMAALYTRAASRARLALSAAGKVQGANKTARTLGPGAGAKAKN